VSSFTEVVYSHINTSLKQKVIPLLKQMEEEVVVYLPNFFEKIFIQDCMSDWHVDFRADLRYTCHQTLERLNVSEICAYSGEFPLFYNGTYICAAVIGQKLSDNSQKVVTTSLLNKWGILARLNELCCKNHQKLYSECGCGTNQSDRSFSDLHRALLNEITHGSTIKLKEKGGLSPTVEKRESNLTQEERTSIVNTLNKQLGLPKSQAKSMLDKITKQHPEYGFHDIVDACLKGIK